MSDLSERARLSPDGGPLSPRLLASWQRSEGYGVSVGEIAPTFSGTLETDSLFFECGRQVLTDLHRTLIGEPVSLMLTDPDGLVLNRVSGDEALLRSLDRNHLAPGFAYSERGVGTNGLGLALADRAPSLVRADEHYSLSLCSYTCAAAPVIDPITGRLEGAVNLTTWSETNHDLLLALAQSAASTTSAMMLVRTHGKQTKPSPRGEVFRVVAPQLEPGLGSVRSASASWLSTVSAARTAIESGRIVTAVGEPGSGRTTALAQVIRDLHPRDHRILAATVPDAQDMERWLALWGPELGKPDTSVIVRGADRLPAWVAERLRDMVVAAGLGDAPDLALTAERFDDLDPALTALVGSVVQVDPLRERVDDVLPITRQIARQARGREVEVSPGAAQALTDHAWPGNVSELVEIVRDAAMKSDVVEVRHLPPSVLAGPGRRLSRIEKFERDEIIRVISRPDVTMRQASDELGMGRATLYRKLQQYDIHVPR